jgi:DeoR/GlpR family transcriptional regulator of sugar metabolism
MLAHQRQSAIYDTVRKRGGARIAELMRQFGVSQITIRRDLEVLADRGLVAKVHGGATPVDHLSAMEPGFVAKRDRQLEEKTAIAIRAAQLVSPGTAVALSAGTTTCLLARHLVDVPALTVLTNSVPVADVFYRTPREDRMVVLTGGIRTPSDALVGPFTVNTLAPVQPRSALPRRTRNELAGRVHDAESPGGRGESRPGRHRPQARRRGRSHQMGDAGHLHDRAVGRRARVGQRRRS